MPSQYSNKTSASAHFKHQATPSKHSKKAKKTKKTKKEPKHKKAKKEKKSTGESALPKKKAEAQPTTSPHEKTRMGHLNPQVKATHFCSKCLKVATMGCVLPLELLPPNFAIPASACMGSHHNWAPLDVAPAPVVPLPQVSINYQLQSNCFTFTKLPYCVGRGRRRSSYCRGVVGLHTPSDIKHAK